MLPPRTCSAHKQGFTLVELMVVMAIIAIAFFALRPGVAGAFRGATNRKATRQLVGLLTVARTQAIAEGKLVRVLCDPRAGILWAEAQVDPAVDREEFELLRLLGREQVELPRSLSIYDLVVAGQAAQHSSQSPIYFYPDGRTDGALLILVDEKGRETAVELAATTGRVTVRA